MACKERVGRERVEVWSFQAQNEGETERGIRRKRRREGTAQTRRRF
jgi:hypothetical protein